MVEGRVEEKKELMIGEGMSADECYTHYDRNPLPRLHARFLAEEWFVQCDTSSAEAHEEKESEREELLSLIKYDNGCRTRLLH